MKTPCLVFTALSALAIAAFAQGSSKPFLGRWDLTLTGPHGSWPQWIELTEKDGKIDGRIQPRGGAVRPIVAAKMEGGHLAITVKRGGPRPGDRLGSYR